MKILWAALIPVLIVLPAGMTSAEEKWVARFDGMGPLRIGMTVPELSRALRQKIEMPDDPRDRSCVYLAAAKPKGILIMITGERLARIDITSREFPTVDGARIGDSENRVVALYGGRIQVAPHAYTAPDGHYLTIRAPSGNLGIRFETYQGRVSSFYVGKFPEIEFIEQCL